MANQINIIRPFKWEGMWVFDDDRVGLAKEPFVAGADTIIDAAIKHKGIANADDGFLLVFSKDPFPEAELALEWVREEFGGNVYRWGEMEGWLCPALLKYFDTAPRQIYAQMRELRKK